ncbi:hypothetical protein LIA77_10992 [Sarocladium implicatum]|nr:hypothetical protein LIA77_10992 [Sarocladium implicatum]
MEEDLLSADACRFRSNYDAPSSTSIQPPPPSFCPPTPTRDTYLSHVPSKACLHLHRDLHARLQPHDPLDGAHYTMYAPNCGLGPTVRRLGCRCSSLRCCRCPASPHRASPHLDCNCPRCSLFPLQCLSQPSVPHQASPILEFSGGSSTIRLYLRRKRCDNSGPRHHLSSIPAIDQGTRFRQEVRLWHPTLRTHTPSSGPAVDVSQTNPDSS